MEKVLIRKKGSVPGGFEPFLVSQNEPRIKISSKAIEQTHIDLGFPAFSRSDKDRFVLGLIHVILGGNMSSRLFNEVREKKGLAYEIATHAKKLKDTGVFYVHAGIDNRKLIETTKVIFKELERICSEKVPSGELRRAKDFYIGQTHMALDDSLEHMMWMGDSMTNLGFIQTKEEMRRQVQRVDAAQILRVARRVFDWDRLCFAAVGPQDPSQEAAIRDLWSEARRRTPRDR
jgi:predicted Zn-dependent peptidase